MSRASEPPSLPSPLPSPPQLLAFIVSEPCITPPELFVSPIPSIRTLPNSLRRDFDQMMATLFRHINTAHTPARQEERFARLLAVGKLVLRRHGSHEPRNCNRRSAVHLLRHRMQLAVQGRWRTLRDDAVSAFGSQPNRLPPPTLTASQRCRRAASRRSNREGRTGTHITL